MVMKRSALGRGLDALITMDDLKTGGSSSINEIELSKIQPNPEQPRSVFEQEALDELAASIRTLGVIQPITLKEIESDKYMIISGERRYRASLAAGLTSIPAYIRTAEDDNVVEMALIENIQREDLNSIEIALAYQKLIDNYGLTQEKLSERIGKKRTTIANYLRLLKLPAEIQVGLKDKRIDMGHARALIPVDDPEVQLALYEQIIQDGLSVRQVEEMVRSIANGQQTVKKKTEAKEAPSEEFDLLKEQLSNFFQTKVQLVCNKKGKGKITIPFASEEELEKLISLLDNIKLYLCASRYEIENLKQDIYGYRENQLRLVGMARYDGLKSRNQKQVLISPTWRRNLVKKRLGHNKNEYNPIFCGLKSKTSINKVTTL